MDSVFVSDLFHPLECYFCLVHVEFTFVVRTPLLGEGICSGAAAGVSTNSKSGGDSGFFWIMLVAVTGVSANT